MNKSKVLAMKFTGKNYFNCEFQFKLYVKEKTFGVTFMDQQRNPSTR